MRAAAWTVVTFLALTIPTSNAQSSSTWLHPTVSEYRDAIDVGYNLKDLTEATKPSLRLESIQPENDADISFQSPMKCAILAAFIYAEKLRDKPLLADVRKACDGKLLVDISHFSERLGNHWPITLRHGDVVLQPADRNYSQPDVLTYRDRVGYSYFDHYTFKPPMAWHDEVTITWADDDGARHSKTVDFSVLVQHGGLESEKP